MIIMTSNWPTKRDFWPEKYIFNFCLFSRRLFLAPRPSYAGTSYIFKKIYILNV